MNPVVEKARKAWGDDMPEWVEALAVECSMASQNRVGARIGRSGSLISMVLANRYAGDLRAVEELFNGVFRNARIDCPALGTIPAHECRHWREKGRQFVNINSLRVRMYRACRNCPRNQKEASDEKA